MLSMKQRQCPFPIQQFSGSNLAEPRGVLQHCSSTRECAHERGIHHGSCAVLGPHRQVDAHSISLARASRCNGFVQPPGCGSSVSAGEDSTGSIAAALDPIPCQPQSCQESLGSNTWGRVKRRGSGNTSRLRTGSTDLPSTLVLANITLLPNHMGPKTPFFPTSHEGSVCSLLHY